jgi:uncharacterized protein YbcC (UPF0753/DUF2309 family)
LTSYDPTIDTDDGQILGRILEAVIPVCAGINLEYYFCIVDSPGYGCGSKLPHNITSLLGVMDGAASDLRTGLPIQMTEIHEPVRCLFVLEQTPEVALAVIQRSANVSRIVMNEWVQLATLDPSTSKLHLLRNGKFEPYAPEAAELPAVQRSVDWYRGWRDHLTFASVLGGLASRPPANGKDTAE